MASEAEIQAAIETLQTAINTYGGFDAPVEVNGELTPELYDLLQQFTEGFAEIGGVATILNEAGINIEGIYDRELGDALVSYFGGDALQIVRTSLAVPLRGEEIAGGILEAAGAPQVFVDNPQLLLDFADRDLAGIVAAINTLEDEGILNARPQELSDEQIAAQPAAIEAMETAIRDDLTYYRDYAQGRVDSLQEQLDALDEDAEERPAIEAMIGNAQRTVDLLNPALEAIDGADPDQEFDENYQQALQVYVEFLQRGHQFTAYIEEEANPEGETESSRLDPSEVIDDSGNYTQEYEDFLTARLEAYQERLDELEANDDRTAEEEFEYQVLVRSNAFTGAMEAMVDSGAYIHPAAPGAGEEEEEELDVMPIEEARPIVEQAISAVWNNGMGSVEVKPILGEEDDWEFEFASRVGLQAFIIDLKKFLDIDVDGESGLYSRAFREAVAEAFDSEEVRRDVANRYFRGEESMVLQLLTAMNTYMEEFPELEDGTPAHIGDDVLIAIPDLRDHEVAMMDAAIDRVPEDELLAMNEMIITLTGFGMEDFLPEGTLTEEQALALEVGGDRSEIFGDFYEKVRQEAYDALARDGRPMSDLEAEIQERMVERFNNLVEDNSAFDVIRLEYMRDYIRSSVTAALEAEAAAEGGPHVSREAAQAAFTSGIPSSTTFIADHGPNIRAYFIVDPDEIEGVTPEVMQNFAGQSEGQAATLAEARGMQTMAELVTDMESDFERLSMSHIAQRTMEEVRQTLAETEGLLARIYNDPRNADFIAENGDMIVRGLSGETVLLSQGEDGLEVRYLNALGVNEITDYDDSNILSVGEEFDLDAILIRTAAAGYQSLNDGMEWRHHHNPQFFEMNGRNYVIGMDSGSAGQNGTNTIQIVELDPEFLTASNAARRVYSLGSEQASADTDAAFMNDSAYKFLHDNYDAQLIPAGSADRIFQTMLQQVVTEETQIALSVMGEYYLIDWENQPELQDAPIVEDESIINAVTLFNASRDDDMEVRPFIFLREDGDGNGQILVVSPALREETTTLEDGSQQVVLVHDSTAPPVIRDITDPSLHQGMRDLFLNMSDSIFPIEYLDHEAFADLRSWLDAGGRPLLRTPPTVVEYGEPTAEGLASLFESASGFVAEGRDIEFGTAITETETLVEVLGYDPNSVFADVSNPENAYVLHGIEPAIWQGSEHHHEFLQDHFLVTFMRDGEVVTVAMEKEDVANNPYRISELLRMEHDVESRGAPSILAVDRDTIRTSAEGMQIPVTEFAALINRDGPDLVSRELEEGDPYYGQIEEQSFWDDPSWWEMRQQWIIDRTEWLRSLENDEEAALTEEAERTTIAMFRECSAEMTCDNTGTMSDGDSRSLVAGLTTDAGVRPGA